MIKFKIEPLKNGNLSEFLKLSITTENEKGKEFNSSLACRFHVTSIEMAAELELMLNILMSLHSIKEKK